MGGHVSKFVSDNLNALSVANNVSNFLRKRKRNESFEEEENVIEEALYTPKKKKLKSTAEYIYQVLFVEGNNSDILVRALDTDWKLHKIYLCQSPYFASMFSGSWKEANDSSITIEIVDQKITKESLYCVLGSLYLTEVVVTPVEVIPTLATATLFQLQGLIDQCVEIMIETVNIQTIITYYEASIEYGLSQVKEAVIKWLCFNLLTYLYEYPDKLREISIDLMAELVSCSNLFVLQTEYSIYIMLRFWVFIRLNPDWISRDSNWKQVPTRYFRLRTDYEYFLDSSEGQKYIKAFRKLRLHHMVSHHQDIDTLRLDRIIPQNWLARPIMKQWYQMLWVDQGLDIGPNSISEEEFNKKCLRCGRLLTVSGPGEHVWRWTGYNFGLDLIWTSNDRLVRVKRNIQMDQEYLISMQSRRNLLLRVSLSSLNEQKQVSVSQSSGIKSISLGGNEDAVILVLDTALNFPIFISVNLLVITPKKYPKIESIPSCSEMV